VRSLDDFCGGLTLKDVSSDVGGCDRRHASATEEWRQVFVNPALELVN
jgi:hypothetical protein